MKLICLFILLCHCCVTNKSSVWCANILKICQQCIKNISKIFWKYIQEKETKKETVWLAAKKIVLVEKKAKGCGAQFDAVETHVALSSSTVSFPRTFLSCDKQFIFGWQNGETLHSVLRWKAMWHFQAASFPSLGHFFQTTLEMSKHPDFLRNKWTCQPAERDLCWHSKVILSSGSKITLCILDLAGREKSLKSWDTDSMLILILHLLCKKGKL